MTAELLLWIALLVIGYTYLLYPAIVVILAALYPATVRKSDAYVPTISVAIAAHNEAARIAVKVQDCLALDYPPEQLEVIVVSDGSSDDTAAILDQLHARVSDRVKVASWDRRRGKAVSGHPSDARLTRCANARSQLRRSRSWCGERRASASR